MSPEGHPGRAVLFGNAPKQRQKHGFSQSLEKPLFSGECHRDAGKEDKCLLYFLSPWIWSFQTPQKCPCCLPSSFLNQTHCFHYSSGNLFPVTHYLLPAVPH